MGEDDGLICAYALDGLGGGAALGWEALDRSIEDETGPLTWIHVNRTNARAQNWLKTGSGLDAMAIRALLAEDTRPRCTAFSDGVLLNLRGVNLNPSQDPANMVAIRLWITPHCIISARLHKIAAIANIRDKIEQGTGPKTVGQFVAMLAAGLTERMEPALDSLEDELGDLEERLVDEPGVGLRKELGAVRRRAISLRRYISSQREALSELATARPPWLESEDREHLLEQVDRVTRYVEDLDVIRERAFVLQDELYSQLSDRMNRIVYLLTIITGVFLPISFLTGLFGVNIGGMPGVESPVAFLYFCLGMVVLIFVELLIFRFLKWI
ncbi:transporter [Iodidimonas gelatinilytica]|uniref:Transporter n=1 Tax=Iodidimonas gelatinilytica TaxID=1236966 RepID=A0A5A7MU07_9PROT|nr:zinc transporter ZntB [Iodidimonas gelatinilytica]GEQ99104.1 transporter [Iodidimonas gelatinilytica]